nr:MAG TPA: hypothetical protein [Caudoviricetes sp.]
MVVFVFNISFSLFPFLYYKYIKLLEITQHFSKKNVLYLICFNYILTYRILCLHIELSLQRVAFLLLGFPYYPHMETPLVCFFFYC